VRIDLHAHSSASDGTETPADLMRAAADAGLDVVALTDHDTVRGWAAATEALPSGLRLVRGAEISCVYDGVSLHLLAYLFDPEHAALAEEMSMALDDRVPRAKAIVGKLAAAGHPITWELVLAQLQDGATVGRPHIADTLVAIGVVPDRTAAFDTLLHDGSEFFVGHYYVDAVRAVELVREAGGVPVFAHPAAAKRGTTVGDDAIVAMAGAGLAGLEVDHRDNPPEARDRLRALAADLDLLVTGASDYHGSGKDNRLGEHTTDPAVLEELLGQATSGMALVST
jgi:predicted metal-dependent phosphoesterase TrpH